MSTLRTQAILMTPGQMAQEFNVGYEDVNRVIESRGIVHVHEGPRRYDADAIAQVRAALMKDETRALPNVGETRSKRK